MLKQTFDFIVECVVRVLFWDTVDNSSPLDTLKGCCGGLILLGVWLVLVRLLAFILDRIKQMKAQKKETRP